jgi:small subunit ribosomal protein S8
MVTRYSGLKKSILEVLKKHSYIVDFQVDDNKCFIAVTLKKDVFSHLKRISKPGQRIYARSKEIPKPLSGYGLVIVSTPHGVIDGKEAKRLGIGGEVICEVW